jgi:hypothetical protein
VKFLQCCKWAAYHFKNLLSIFDCESLNDHPKARAFLAWSKLKSLPGQAWVELMKSCRPARHKKRRESAHRDVTWPPTVSHDCGQCLTLIPLCAAATVVFHYIFSQHTLGLFSVGGGNKVWQRRNESSQLWTEVTLVSLSVWVFSAWCTAAQY